MIFYVLLYAKENATGTFWASWSRLELVLMWGQHSSQTMSPSSYTPGDPKLSEGLEESEDPRYKMNSTPHPQSSLECLFCRSLGFYTLCLPKARHTFSTPGLEKPLDVRSLLSMLITCHYALFPPLMPVKRILAKQTSGNPISIPGSLEPAAKGSDPRCPEVAGAGRGQGAGRGDTLPARYSMTAAM